MFALQSIRRRAGTAAAAFVLLGLLLAAGTALAAGDLLAPLPGLITSAGQSSDVVMVKVLANTQLKLDLAYNPLVKAGELEGVKTLVVVVGSSAKGLGAAGLNEQQEMERVTGLLDRAEKEGLFVLMMHVGGTARRGPSSNRLIEAVGARADAMIVVKAGNGDGIFTRLAEERGIPIYEVDRVTDAREPLKKLFGAR